MGFTFFNKMLDVLCRRKDINANTIESDIGISEAKIPEAINEDLECEKESPTGIEVFNFLIENQKQIRNKEDAFRLLLSHWSESKLQPSPPFVAAMHAFSELSELEKAEYKKTLELKKQGLEYEKETPTSIEIFNFLIENRKQIRSEEDAFKLLLRHWSDGEMPCTPPFIVAIHAFFNEFSELEKAEYEKTLELKKQVLNTDDLEHVKAYPSSIEIFDKLTENQKYIKCKEDAFRILSSHWSDIEMLSSPPFVVAISQFFNEDDVIEKSEHEKALELKKQVIGIAEEKGVFESINWLINEYNIGCSDEIESCTNENAIINAEENEGCKKHFSFKFKNQHYELLLENESLLDLPDSICWYCGDIRLLVDNEVVFKTRYRRFLNEEWYENNENELMNNPDILLLGDWINHFPEAIKLEQAAIEKRRQEQKVKNQHKETKQIMANFDLGDFER